MLVITLKRMTTLSVDLILRKLNRIQVQINNFLIQVMKLMQLILIYGYKVD